LTIALLNAGARNSFASGGSEEILRQAAIDVIGQDWRIEAIVDPTAQPGTAGEAPARASTAAPPRPEPEPERPVEQRRAADPAAVASAREAIQETRGAGEPRERTSSVSDDDVDPDDPDADDHGMDATQLLEHRLGASIIEEIRHD
jgi:DNA polymerase-3 subunit gamma/tau